MTEGGVLVATGVRKTYQVGSSRVVAVAGVSLDVSPGEIVALRGRSGSGKSTLLNILGLLTRPDSGEVSVCGIATSAESARAIADLRARQLGFVFQAFNLLGHLSAVENVVLASPLSDRRARSEALNLLDRAGLRDRADHRPSQLSGGEQQRVALVRAMINKPRLIIADEPTGNLDAESEAIVLSELRKAAADGRAVLVASHSETVCGSADRVITIDAGVISGPGPADARSRSADVAGVSRGNGRFDES